MKLGQNTVQVHERRLGGLTDPGQELPAAVRHSCADLQGVGQTAGGHDDRHNTSHKQACAVPQKNFLCCGMLRHAAACFWLHMWVPALLWEIEHTKKRQHAQHCWAELITFTIRIVCSGFVDIHHSQMAQSVVAHMQTVLCLDVAHQTERSLNMASRAWSSDKQNSNATQRREIVFFGCTQVQLVLAVGR